MKKWTIGLPPSLEKTNALHAALKINKYLCALLVQRGVETYEQAEAFFNPSLKDLHDPFLMLDMDKAVARLETAFAKGEIIMVYGDYDVDGVASVAMMVSFIQARHPRVTKYIPDRQAEGYGISLRGIEEAHRQGVSLIIALDCGISSPSEIAHAKGLGIDFIVCDHHLPNEKALPDAVALLDPKREGCGYPYKGLCGCGVGFKLLQAIVRKEGKPLTHLEPYLDLVAIASAADIVPLTGENRVLVRAGMEQIKKNARPGISALAAGAAISKTSDIVFKIAPKINAAGRIAHALDSVDLLLERDVSEAERKSLKIVQINDNRREIDKDITAAALEQITENGEENAPFTIVSHQGWHKGVVGIVASRLIDAYYRPTIVLSENDGLLAGSGRSVGDFDLYKALEPHKHLFLKFGGHSHAIGLSMKKENLPELKKAMEGYIHEKYGSMSFFHKQMTADMSIEPSELTPTFVNILSRFAPFGPGNMNPIFYMEELRVEDLQLRGKESEHLSFRAPLPHFPFPVRVIGFNLGSKIEFVENHTSIRAMFSIEENHWNGQSYTELRLRDIIEEGLQP